MPPDLRVQLGVAGDHGREVHPDRLLPSETIRATLPFPVPENYIPAAVSTMKNLEDSVVKAVDRFPEIADYPAIALAR